MNLKIQDIKEGFTLPVFRREVTQEHINLYAAASGDFNPIHIDYKFARKTPLGGTIAHGMLIMAYISEFMTYSFGEYWLTGSTFDCRFKNPARPGDKLTINGKVTTITKEEGDIAIQCDVMCRNQNNEPVIICDTKVRVKDNENSC